MSAESIDRTMHPLFQAGEGGSTPTSALQLRFDSISRWQFAILNRKWHSRLPKIGASQGRAFYGASFEGLFYAVAMWSNPVARLLPQTSWLELRRLAIAPDAPKNAASRMLAWMAREIRSRFPEVVKLISYQDLAVHKGTIYRAAGWHEADGYKPRARGWAPTTSWASRYRAGRTNQAVSPRMRWEKDIRQEDPLTPSDERRK